MSWNSMNDYVPIVGSVANAGLVALALRRDAVSWRRKLLIAVILISALSIALYWSDAPNVVADGRITRAQPPLLAHLGLWAMKITVMVAGIGVAMASWFADSAIRPLLYTLMGLAGATGVLMTVALTG